MRHLLAALIAASALVIGSAGTAAALAPWETGPHTEPGPRGTTPDTNRQGA